MGRGGAVTHEHFRASDQNLAALARAGVTKIAVQVRDPRQAFLSFIHHLARHKHSPTVGDLLDIDFDAAAAESLQVIYVAMIDWIQAWVAISERPNALELHFLRYDAFVADKPRCVEDLLSFFGVSVLHKLIARRRRAIFFRHTVAGETVLYSSRIVTGCVFGLGGVRILYILW